MIDINNLYYSFKDRLVLKNINLNINEGVVGILGPNGAGKTTLFRCICGLYDNYKGDILLNGKKEISKAEIIGYLPQHFSVIPYIRVKDIMYYYATLKGIDRKKRNSEIERTLSLVSLSDYSNVYGNTLSGGMLRRLGIAIAIMGSPNIIIMDEPTVGLDPEERLKFIGLIKKLEKGCLIILSTHIVEDLRGNCNNIIIMKDGRILFCGSEDLLCTIDDSNKKVTLEEGYLHVIKSDGGL